MQLRLFIVVHYVVLYWGNYQQSINTPGEHFIPSHGIYYYYLKVDSKEMDDCAK